MKLDYHLNILGEKKEYSPRKEFIQPIIESNSRIFEIVAENSYGKTFLLNLIGYACFADKLDEKYILNSLKDSIARYNNRDSYLLEYEIDFVLPDGKILVLKKEREGERIFSINGETENDYQELHKQISVLYDVPVDPSERLNAVITDLGKWNSNLQSKITKYWEYLRGVQSDFNNVRDASKIATLKNTIVKIETDICLKKDNVTELKSQINQLIIYQDLESLIKEHKYLMTLKESLLGVQKRFKTLPKPSSVTKQDEQTIQGIQSEKDSLKKEIDSIMSTLFDFISSSSGIKSLIDENKILKSIFEKVQNIDIESLLESDNYVDDLKKFLENIDDLEEEIKLFIRNEEMGKKFITYNFLKQLLNQIEQLIESEAQEVIEDLTNINSTTLKDEIEKNLKFFQVPDYSEIKSFFKNTLCNLKTKISDLYKLNAKLNKESQKKGIDADGKKFYSLKGEIDSLKNKIKEKESQVNSLKYKIAESLNIDIVKISDLKSANEVFVRKQLMINKKALIDLKGYLKEVNTDLSTKEDEIAELDASKKMNQARLNLEESKSENLYSEVEQEKINRITRNLGFLVKNLGGFSELISSINRNDLSNFKDKEDKEYIQLAGKIIAYSMDNKILRADGEYIQLEFYNMINKEFECEGGIRIKKEDISTGLASANYLRQRIENTEGKYVIVLLDEIGNMSKDTLYEVIKSLKKLELQNRLVLSLLTRPQSKGIEINEF